jgi:ATP-dependent Lon protease
MLNVQNRRSLSRSSGAAAKREQRVTLPSSPRVGEVVGLAVIGDDRGCLLHFEMQASKGSGRIVNLGSMQKVMKESVAAAAQFIKSHADDVRLPNDWQDNYDIAVLATMMGVPKEGPSAGITIVTGIVSALTGRPIRNDLAMTGEITIMGKCSASGVFCQNSRRPWKPAALRSLCLKRTNTTCK